MSQRFDVGTLRPALTRADGSLRVDGYLTRSGVFQYLRDDGTIKNEYRPPAEVFNINSLASLELIAVTNDHPREFVGPTNSKEYAVGSVGEKIVVEDNKVRASLSINDAAAIASISAGKVQLSCGYTCDIVEESGITSDGIRYDSYQKNIVYNHVALVSAGRAGPDVRIRVDCGTMISLDKEKGKDSMDLETALKKLVEATTELATANKRADCALGELDALRSKLASVEQSRIDTVNALPALVSARVQLLTRASMYVKTDMSHMTDREVRCAVIATLDKVDVTSDKSDDYVVGRFEATVDSASRVVDACAELRKSVDEVQKTDTTQTLTEETARQAMLDSCRNSWKAKGN